MSMAAAGLGDERRFEHIVLAYSGGLDTSTALHFLKQTFKCTVSAYCANVGQTENWDHLRRRAEAAGADHFVVDDLRDHFLRDFVFPALKANATYEARYLLGTPLARPAIVEGMIRYAERVGADALAHGCTPKGNDQIRFELAATLLRPDLPTIAPWRLWDLASREDCLAYCSRHGIPIIHNENDLLSHDENLVHRTTEGSYLEEIANPFDWSDAGWTTSVDEAPAGGARVVVSFDRGVPVALNGEALEPVALVEALNRAGAANAVGLQDIIENRINGMKVRGVFENPALMILHEAHRRLENATLSHEVQRVRDMNVPQYGDIVYRGLWFSDERIVLQALIDATQRVVSGHVLVALHRGNCNAIAVSSGETLYSRDLVTLHRGAEFSARDADGFIRTLEIAYGSEARRRARSSEDDLSGAIPTSWNHTASS